MDGGRTLEERASLIRRLASNARQQGSTYAEERFTAQARDAEHNARLIREMLLNGKLIDTSLGGESPAGTHGIKASPPGD